MANTNIWKSRALAIRPQLLILDEPAAGMNGSETTELASFITKLNKNGLTVMLVEHDRGLVVLASGRKIADDVPQVVCQHPGVLEAYLGGDD